jgi:hypothetical protein
MPDFEVIASTAHISIYIGMDISPVPGAGALDLNKRLIRL